MSVREQILSAASNTKAGVTVAAVTTGTGVGQQFFDYIPDDIGKAAVVVGIILSVVVCRLHALNIKKINLEMKIMRQREADRIKSLE